MVRTQQRELVEIAARIGKEIASPVASDVDKSARFPHESIGALQSAELMSVLVPGELGGAGADLSLASRICTALARHCATTAMIYAMHQMQVACIVRHGRSEFVRDFLREIVDRQLLLASATTELGIGGNLRMSGCAVEEREGRFSLQKQAPVISYGQFADAVLVTARRTPDSPPNDQVLVLCRAEDCHLEPISSWDTLGFRGTCSLGFALSASGPIEAVLDDPFGEIASETMLPTSHILWSSVWFGIATYALDRARAYVQAEARKQPGVTPPGALRLAELDLVHQRMADSLQSALELYAPYFADGSQKTDLGFAISMNSLKVSSSRVVVDIVGRAMEICGISSYREDSPYSLGRQLRDAYGAGLMVNNDRILANNAQLLLLQKES